ncbi:MAG: glycosyltransferase family 39 protein [Actinomycetota bacterium]|nr:glycosyltransferase family 39 protein [Actinomycetota bacterium]
MLIVVLITGGFVIDAGPLHFSARRWRGPLIVALTAWTSAALLYRRASLADGTASIGPWLDRHASAAAIVIAAAAAGTGVAFGTYAASGADAAGYVSQAELLASARLVRDEPLARQVAWPDATWAFSPLGYRPGPSPGEIVPTYPPGLPLTMAVAHVAGGEWAPFTVVPLLGALALLCTYALGARLHSRTAGVVAAALLATSPIFLFQMVQPMSDVPVTGWWALALLLAVSPQPGSAIAAGATAGFALLTRPNLLPFALVVAVLAAGWPRRSRSQPRVMTSRLWAFAAGVMPASGALMLLQWRIYGSPAASGYGSFGDLFALSNVWPNARDYAWRLVRGEGPALCLAAISFAAILAVSRRAGQLRAGLATRQSVAGPASVAAVVAAAVLVCYLPYGVFAEWSYLRFLLPAFPAAFVVVGALLTSASTLLPQYARGLMLLAAITAAGAANINRASGEQAFNLRRYEARYRDAGRYLDSALPPAAVVFAVQQSASASHYARKPVVRWDLLRVDLDSAVSTLTALGRPPVLLVEDWEAADLRARFPASAVARLDWTPRADVGSDIRVRLFDPADRGKPPDHIVTDRLP